MGDKTLLDKTLQEFKLDAVMRFAEFIQAGESVMATLRYNYNNISQEQTLIHGLVNGTTL
jgi:UDP-glucose 4-epimerase